MPVRAGVNRFVWDARHNEAERLRGNKTASEAERGPLALPGQYRVELTVVDETTTQLFQLVNDSRSPATSSELHEQLTLLLKIRDKLSELYLTLRQLREIRGQLQSWMGRLVTEPTQTVVLQTTTAMIGSLDDIESLLVMPGEKQYVFGLHDRVRLNAALASVIRVI